MKHRILLSFSTALLVVTAACSHKPNTVAVVPPPTTGGITTPPEAPAPVKVVRNNEPVRASGTTQAAPGRMTSEERTQLNTSLARMEDALFDYDKATIRPDAMKALQDDVAVIRTTMARYPKETISIEGHADERGSAEYNLGLGDRRATAAREFLVNLGISKEQLTVISYGKEKPVCKEEDETCYQKNRRAHLVASN